MGPPKSLRTIIYTNPIKNAVKREITKTYFAATISAKYYAIPVPPKYLVNTSLNSLTTPSSHASLDGTQKLPPAKEVSYLNYSPTTTVAG